MSENILTPEQMRSASVQLSGDVVKHFFNSPYVGDIFADTLDKATGRYWANSVQVSDNQHLLIVDCWSPVTTLAGKLTQQVGEFVHGLQQGNHVIMLTNAREGIEMKGAVKNRAGMEGLRNGLFTLVKEAGKIDKLLYLLPSNDRNSIDTLNLFLRGPLAKKIAIGHSLNELHLWG